MRTVVIVVTKGEEKVYSKFDRAFYTHDPPLADYTDITQNTIKEAKERVKEHIKRRHLQETPVFVVSARKYRTFIIEQGRLESLNDQRNNNEQLSVEDSNDGTNDHREEENVPNEQHEKNTVLSFELNHLLDHLAMTTLHRHL